MTAIVRETPRLLETEDEPIEFCCVTRPGYVFVKRADSVRILPLASETDDHCDASTYRVCGSGVSGGEYSEVKSDISRGVVLLPSSSDGAHQHSGAVSGFGLCLRNSNHHDVYTVGVFESVSGLRGSEPSSSAELYKKANDVSPRRLVYKLQRCVQLKKNQSVVHIAPLATAPLTFEVDKMIMLTERVNGPSLTKELTVHLVATKSLEPLVSPVVLPAPPPSASELSKWRVVALETTDPETLVFAIWARLSCDAEGAILGTAVYSLAANALRVVGWYSVPVPEGASCLTSVEAVPQGRDCTFALRSNVALIWDKSIYSCYSLQPTAFSGSLALDIQLLRTFDVRPLEATGKLTSYVSPLLPSLFLEGHWSHREGSLYLRLRHTLDGTSFRSLSNDGSSSDLEPGWLSLGLPAVPKSCITANVDQSVVVVMACKNQIYVHTFHGLHNYTSASFLGFKEDRSSWGTRLPSAKMLQVLGFPDVDLAQKTFAFAMDLKSQSTSIPPLEFGPTLTQLVQRGLLRLTVPIVDRFLDLELQDCCRGLIRSTLISEAIYVRLLQRSPELYLQDIVTHISATRPVIVRELRKQLGIRQLEIILERLALWCSVLTGLPTVVTEAADLPPFHKVVDFVSLLIDAKFREMTNVRNPALLNSIQDIAASLSDTLVVKKNMQKLIGQLYAIDTATADPKSMARTHPPTPPVERVLVNI